MVGTGCLQITAERWSPIPLEGYASGRFQIQAEVKRFLEAQPEFPKVKGGIVLNEKVKQLLTRPVYAGYVQAPNWGIPLRKGHHEPLINFETFTKIQERLNGTAKAPRRKDINADFPLRGAVICGHCGTPLTACWSSGVGGRYPYYHCPKRGCESYGKSIRRDIIESEFETLLHALEPSEKLFRFACTTFKEDWDKCEESRTQRAQSLKADLAKIEREVEQFLDRIADAQTPSVISAYENRIRKLEEQKITVSEKIASCGRALPNFEQSLRTALDFLGNPSKTWASERLEDKRIVLKLAFADRLAYVRKMGFRTPNLTLPFKALADFSAGKIEMAHRRG